jgi:D-3-phosphoglycerate dehydrogenase / 2-oxoglutarate reductase
LIGEAELASMRPGALLVNTARGEITDEAALLDALESGRLGGAAIDTLAAEQPDGSHLVGNPLVAYARAHQNLIVLPHLGGATSEATERTQMYISLKLAEWLESTR